MPKLISFFASKFSHFQYVILWRGRESQSQPIRGREGGGGTNLGLRNHSQGVESLNLNLNQIWGGISISSLLGLEV